MWYCVAIVYATETAGFCLVSFVCFEAGSYYVAQDDLELAR